MSPLTYSTLVTLFSGTVPLRPFVQPAVNPLNEFARKNLAAIDKELSGLNLTEQKICHKRFQELSGELDEKVSTRLFRLVFLNEIRERQGKFAGDPVPSAAQHQLGLFLSLEQGLEQWKSDPESKGSTEIAAERIRKAFLTHSTSLDLSGLGLNDLPESLILLQDLREVKLFKNAFTRETLPKLKTRLPAGVRLVNREEYAGKDAPRHPVKASASCDLDAKSYKSLEERRLEKVGQMWDCVECIPDVYGGFRYKFMVKPEYLEQGLWMRVETHLEKRSEIFPAIEAHIGLQRELVKDVFPKESDGVALGFEYGGEGKDFFVWIPDVESLTARYTLLRENQPERGLPEYLDIVRSAGVAGDMDFVEALVTHNGLVSDESEFFHDMTIHILQLLEDMLEPNTLVHHTALFEEWRAIQDLLSEMSLPDLDLSKKDSVFAAAKALKDAVDRNREGLMQAGLHQRLIQLVIDLGSRALSLRPYVHARHAYAVGIAQSWAKLLLLKQKLAGGMKDIPLENPAKMKELLPFLETSLGAVADLDSVDSTQYSSLDRDSFSMLWHNPEWIGYANRRYGKKPDAAYQQLVKDLEAAWDAVESFVEKWKAARAQKRFIQQGLLDWEQNPNVEGNKKEAVKRILASIEASDNGLPSPTLNLSNLGLTQLPKGFDTMTHLTSIDLSSNHLTRIPDGIQTLPLLQEVNLANNQISSSLIDQDVIESKHLRHLNLSNNTYTHLSRLRLLSKEVQSLDLSHNGALGWFSWYNFVSNSDRLELLDIEGNQFKGICEALSDWKAPTSLKEIRLVGVPLDDFSFSKQEFVQWAEINRVSLKI